MISQHERLHTHVCMKFMKLKSISHLYPADRIRPDALQTPQGYRHKLNDLHNFCTVVIWLTHIWYLRFVS